MGPGLDIAAVTHWIGRTSTAEDAVSERLLAELRATLAPHLFESDHPDVAPPALHWCLAPMTGPLAELGPDGLPAETGLIPATPMPRRMWAGGEIETHGSLKLGDRVRRNSVIADVSVKDGRSGRLLFVTVSHEYVTARGLAIRDRQDIVFRAAAAATPKSTPLGARQPAPTERPDLIWQIEGSTTLLFRYSAITFNAHRIHYDLPYATEVEGYPGLLVHGPLQASLLVNMAATHLGRVPRRFAYRSVAPLVAGSRFQACAGRGHGGTLRCWIADAAGLVTMTADIDE